MSTSQSFRVEPLEGAFAARVRESLHDDFNRPVLVARASGGEPLRDQLRRAVLGESIILCSYKAVPLPSRYAEIGPIFISGVEAPEARSFDNRLPPGYFQGPFALRAYNAAHEIVGSALAEPSHAAGEIHRLLADEHVACLHARFAGHGCFAARITRG